MNYLLWGKTRILIGGPLLGALALMLMALPVAQAQQAKARQVKVSGGIDVGFGILDQESTGGFKKLEAASTARIKFAAKLGKFEGEAEIGFIDDAQVEYTEHAVYWKPNDATTVTLSGSAFGVPGVDGFLGVIAGEGTGTLGDLDVYFDYSDAGLFNVNYATDALTLGIGVSDTCIPECGDDGTGTGADEERNTIILTLQGKSGTFRYQVYGVSSTGIFSAGLEEGKGRGFGGSVGYAADAFEISSDVSIGTVKCVSSLGCTDDVETTNFGVALQAKGFGIQFVSLTTEVGAGETETTGIDVVYHFKSDQVTYGPQYSEEGFDDGTGEVTDTFLYFAISVEF